MATFDWSSDGSKLAWLQVQEVRDIVSVALPAAERAAFRRDAETLRRGHDHVDFLETRAIVTIV
jgi:hypothetical protein